MLAAVKVWPTPCNTITRTYRLLTRERLVSFTGRFSILGTPVDVPIFANSQTSRFNVLLAVPESERVVAWKDACLNHNRRSTPYMG